MTPDSPYQPLPDAGSRTGARPDASMSLLMRLAEESLDAGYAQAAERKLREGRSAATFRPGPLLAAALGLVGLLLATAAALVSARQPAVAVARQQTVSEISRRTAAADQAQAAVSRLQGQVSELRRQALLAQAQPAAAAALRRLEIDTGASAVSGPGVRVTIKDAPLGTAQQPGTRGVAAASDTGRVLDRDLQIVVNGLLLAGAEAVAINDQRLTPLSAIRSAGAAILVDYRPLTPPYTVDAIGMSAGLASRFDGGPAASYLATLSDSYGIASTVTPRGSLTLPASASLSTRLATAVAEAP